MGFLDWLSDPPAWFYACTGAFVGGLSGLLFAWVLGRLWPFQGGALASRWVLWPATAVIVWGMAVLAASAFVVGHRPIYGDGPGLLPR